MSIETFVGKCVIEMAENNTQVIFQPTEQVNFYGEEEKCSGFFWTPEEGKGELVCATKREDWLSIFIHEYNHFKQWMSKKDSWENDDCGLEEAIEVMKKDGYSKSNVDELIMPSYWCEKDCEERSYQMIKENSLDIDLVEYSKKANAYLVMYLCLSHMGSWSNKQSPYEIKEILDLMPGKICGYRDHLKLAEQTKDIYKQHCA